MSAYETQYIFEAGGEGWAVVDFDDDEMTIKETRCNGQEDCHMMATLQRQADGTWKLEQPNMITEEAGERVAAAVEAFVTENGMPTVPALSRRLPWICTCGQHYELRAELRPPKLDLSVGFVEP